MLNIGEKFTLPDESITQTFAVLAKRGVGKTYFMLKMVEEFFESKLRAVIVDPVGVCWGLRTSIDGKGPGLPIIIFGGDHADVPLEKEGGALVADIVVDENISCILDLSHFRKKEQVRFMCDFAERLYHRNRDPLHLFLDEADMFAPQRPMHGEERMLGAIEDIVRRGRARGIGVTLGTQRPAVLNKNVLTQIEVLVVLRTPSPQDQNAIDAWIKIHGTENERSQMMKSLASLPVGTAWFWSPGWLNVFQKVAISERKTFDSSKTPKVGSRKVIPKTMAEIDISLFKDKMAATIERAMADNPKELKKQVADLHRQLLQAQRQRPEPKPCGHEEIIRKLQTQLEASESNNKIIMSFIEQLQSGLVEVNKSIETLIGICERARLYIDDHAVGNIEIKLPVIKQETITRVKRDIENKTLIINDLNPSQSRIINALAALEQFGIAHPEKATVAAHSEYSPGSGGFNNLLSKLRTAQLIEYPQPGCVCLTDAGRAVSIIDKPIENLADLHNSWLQIIKSSSQKIIIGRLIGIYPQSITRRNLALDCGFAPGSGGFNNNISKLKTLGALDYPITGEVKAAAILFPKGLK